MSAYENGLLLALVVSVLVAALLLFSIAIFHLIYNAIPSIPWYWSPEETHQIGAPHNVGSLLPSEDKYKTDERGRQLSTLSRFREKDFPLREALHQYHLDSISYALGLTEIEKEVCEVTRQNDAAGYWAFLARERLNRRRHDKMGLGVEGTFIFIILRKFLNPGQPARVLGRLTKFFQDFWTQIIQKALRFVEFRGATEQWGEARSELGTEATTEPSAWIEELQIFWKNVNSLCQHVGSEVDELATPKESIYRLRKYASEGKQKMSPLFREIAFLNDKLVSYKRINAALQTRHSMERLVAQLPQSYCGGYATTPKWKKLWGDIWKDAATNVRNPFHVTWREAKGERARKHISDKGEGLYGYMSDEIHWYDQRNFDYQHFDNATKKICHILRPTIVDGQIDWAKELAKYLKVEVEPGELPPAAADELSGESLGESPAGAPTESPTELPSNSSPEPETTALTELCKRKLEPRSESEEPSTESPLLSLPTTSLTELLPTIIEASARSSREALCEDVASLRELFEGPGEPSDASQDNE